MDQIKFKVNSKKALYDAFLDLYPDLTKHTWGFEGFNWDNQRRSILICLTEEPLEMGTWVLFEVSRDPDDGQWTQFRALLIPMTGTKGRLNE